MNTKEHITDGFEVVEEGSIDASFLLEEQDSKETFVYTSFDKREFDDLENRKIYINYEIDEEVINDAVYKILKINSIDKFTPVEERKPILMYLATPGGSVIDGFSLIDVMLLSKTPIYVINYAYNYSMGFLIGLAGSKRYGTANSTYLMHDGSSFQWGSQNKVFDTVEFQKRQEDKIKKYILDRTKITEEMYDKKYRTEWYMFAEEAKEQGCCDYIVGVDCDLDEII